jgi:hypothetical protein
METTGFEMLVGDFDRNIVYSIEGLYRGKFIDLEDIGFKKQLEGFPSYIITHARNIRTYLEDEMVVRSAIISFATNAVREQFYSLNPGYLWIDTTKTKKS